MQKYEARPQPNGDYEVWRSIPGSKAGPQRVATFYNYSTNSCNIAEVNAKEFVEDQNQNEMLLAGFMKTIAEIKETGKEGQ